MRRRLLPLGLALPLLAACGPAVPAEPPAAVFALGSLRGEARWIGEPARIPGVHLTIRNESATPAWWRGVPANSREGWVQPPRDADGKLWFADQLPHTGDTFEESTPALPDDPAIWRLEPGAARDWTVHPFAGAADAPAGGFERWEYAVAICLPAEQPPRHALDYRTAELRLSWSRDAGLVARIAE